MTFDEEQCALFGPCLSSIVYKWHKGLISHLCATTATPSHSSNRNSVQWKYNFQVVQQPQAPVIIQTNP